MLSVLRAFMAVGLPLLVAVLALGTGIDVVEVQGDSMEPTIRDGQRVFVNRLAYGLRLPYSQGYIVQWNSPNNGDVVVYSNPVDGRLVIKRCWAGPGGKLQLRDDALEAHGRAKPVSSFVTQQIAGLPSVPAGFALFVGNDARESLDSRHYGLVSTNRVLGSVMGVR